MSPRALTAAAIAVTVSLWGTAFVAIRATLPHLGWASLASVRLLLAAAVLGLIARRAGVRRPAARQLPLLAVIGATGYTGYQLLLSAGEESVPAGASAMLFAAAPVLAALLARPVLGDRLAARGWIGLAVAVAGVATVAVTQGASGGSVDGALLVLAATASYAVWIVLSKRALGSLRALDVTVWATWFGAAFSLPFATGAPAALAHAPAGALAGVLLLGVVITTIPFLLWTWVLARVPASAAAPCLLLIAPAALITGWLWLGETPSPVALAGGALTLAGVALVQRALGRPERVTPPAAPRPAAAARLRPGAAPPRAASPGALVG
jgi:drug/metabolite transporter (DMT)-like permease